MHVHIAVNVYELYEHVWTLDCVLECVHCGVLMGAMLRCVLTCTCVSVEL